MDPSGRRASLPSNLQLPSFRDVFSEASRAQTRDTTQGPSGPARAERDWRRIDLPPLSAVHEDFDSATRRHPVVRTEDDEEDQLWADQAYSYPPPPRQDWTTSASAASSSSSSLSAAQRSRRASAPHLMAQQGPLPPAPASPAFGPSSFRFHQRPRSNTTSGDGHDSDIESVPASSIGSPALGPIALPHPPPMPPFATGGPPKSGIKRRRAAPGRPRAKSVGAPIASTSKNTPPPLTTATSAVPVPSPPPEIEFVRDPEAQPKPVKQPGMPADVVARLRKEPLTPHETLLLQKQIDTHSTTGGTPRQLNIAMFVRSSWLYCRKMGTVPPQVPADAWRNYMASYNPGQTTALRQALTPDQTAYWQRRCDILHAHHSATFPDYQFAPKHKSREEKEQLRTQRVREDAKLATLGHAKYATTTNVDDTPPPRKRGRSDAFEHPPQPPPMPQGNVPAWQSITGGGYQGVGGGRGRKGGFGAATMARVKSSSVGGGLADKQMAAAALAASTTFAHPSSGVGRLRPVNWDASSASMANDVPRFDPMSWADREVSPTSDYSGYESED